MPPGCCGSKEDSGEIIQTRTNISINEDSPDSIQLTYKVFGASSSSCTFRWEQTDGGYIGKMMARDGNQLYTHTFPNPVPAEIRQQLGEPRASKNGDYVIFTLKRPNRNISLMNYVRK